MVSNVQFDRLVHFKFISAIAEVLQSSIQAMADSSRATGDRIRNSDCFSNVVNNFISGFNLKLSSNGKSIESSSKLKLPISYDFAKMVFSKVLTLFKAFTRLNYRKERETVNESRKLCEAQQRSLKNQAEQLVADLSNASRKIVADVSSLKKNLEKLQEELRKVILRSRELADIVLNASKNAEPQTTMDEDDMIALENRCRLLTVFLKSLSSGNFQCPFEESSELAYEHNELVETYNEMKNPTSREQFVTNLQDDLRSLQSPVECSSVNLDDVHRQIAEVREVECHLKAQIHELDAQILVRRSSGEK
jgi:hypothetical protein